MTAGEAQPDWLAGYVGLLRRRIGFVLPQRNQRALEKAVRELAQLHGYQEPAAALPLLESVPIENAQLQAVVQAVTINESYFFRDPPAMTALRHRLLQQRELLAHPGMELAAARQMHRTAHRLEVLRSQLR